MTRDPWRRPARRAFAGVRAIGQGLLGVALIALAAFVLLPSANAAEGAAPVTLEDQAFAADARVAGTALRLNGVGLRAAFIYKVYVAGLYLPTPARSGAAVRAEAGPKRLQVRLLMDGRSDDFARAFAGGIARRVPVGLNDRIAAFDRVLRGLGDVHKGDVVDLDYAPAVGLTLSVNGRLAGPPVPGPDLFDALLAVFVGDRPVDVRMKAGLLGDVS